MRIADIGTREQSGGIVENDSLISAILWWCSSHHQCPLRLHNYIALESISASATVFLDCPENSCLVLIKSFLLCQGHITTCIKLEGKKSIFLFLLLRLVVCDILSFSLEVCPSCLGANYCTAPVLLGRTDDWAQLGFPAPAQSTTPNALSSNSKHSHILKIVANMAILIKAL